MSIVHAFEHALGREQCRVFSPGLADADLRGVRFASAHVMLSAASPLAWRFTFLRDPLPQLASHLRWLDHYNDPVFHEERAPFSDAMKAVISRVGQTDFADPRAIDALFAWLPDGAPARLRNVQCEVLAARADRIAYRDIDEMAECAIANLADLQFVGIVERIGRDLPRLFRRLDLPGAPVIERRNTVSSRRSFDLRDVSIRGALGRHVVADLRLYRHVIRQRGVRLRIADRWDARG